MRFLTDKQYRVTLALVPRLVKFVLEEEARNRTSQRACNLIWQARDVYDFQASVVRPVNI